MNVASTTALLELLSAQQTTQARAITALVEIAKLLPANPERQPLVDALQATIDALTVQNSTLQVVANILAAELKDKHGS